MYVLCALHPGGLTRDWIRITSEAFRHPDVGLLVACSDGSFALSNAYLLNPNFATDFPNVDDPSQLPRALGLFFALCLRLGRPCGIPLSKPTIKQILLSVEGCVNKKQHEIDFKDLLQHDNVHYANLCQLLRYRDEEFEAIGIDFSVDWGGVNYPLTLEGSIGGGKKECEDVTRRNVRSYIRAVARYQLIHSTADQTSTSHSWR